MLSIRLDQLNLKNLKDFYLIISMLSIFLEFVRTYAEHCLKDIIQLLFSRLVTLSKEQGNSSKVS